MAVQGTQGRTPGVSRRRRAGVRGPLPGLFFPGAAGVRPGRYGRVGGPSRTLGTVGGRGGRLSLVPVAQPRRVPARDDRLGGGGRRRDAVVAGPGDALLAAVAAAVVPAVGGAAAAAAMVAAGERLAAVLVGGDGAGQAGGRGQVRDQGEAGTQPAPQGPPHRPQQARHEESHRVAQTSLTPPNMLCPAEGRVKRLHGNFPPANLPLGNWETAADGETAPAAAANFSRPRPAGFRMVGGSRRTRPMAETPSAPPAEAAPGSKKGAWLKAAIGTLAGLFSGAV